MAACGGDNSGSSAGTATSAGGSASSAASPGSGPAPLALVGTPWNLRSYALSGSTSAQADASAVASLTFQPGGNLAGTTGCNSFSGTYQADDTHLTVVLGPTTLKACTDPPVNAQERAITQLLPTVATYALGDSLTLKASDGGSLLVYGSGIKGLQGTKWA